MLSGLIQYYFKREVDEKQKKIKSTHHFFNQQKSKKSLFFLFCPIACLIFNFIEVLLTNLDSYPQRHRAEAQGCGLHGTRREA